MCLVTSSCNLQGMMPKFCGICSMETGVMSALDHTKIEGANDPQMVAAEAEAAQVAKRAAEALRRSRQACQVSLFRFQPLRLPCLL